MCTKVTYCVLYCGFQLFYARLQLWEHSLWINYTSGESGSGMSSLAYFLSKDTVDHFNTVIKPAVYLSMLYFFTNPRTSFADNYLVLFCLEYCVTGTAYAFAIIFESGIAQLVSKINTHRRKLSAFQLLYNFNFTYKALSLVVFSSSSSCFDSRGDTAKR